MQIGSHDIRVLILDRAQRVASHLSQGGLVNLDLVESIATLGKEYEAALKQEYDAAQKMTDDYVDAYNRARKEMVGG
jgi:hypothetical protein